MEDKLQERLQVVESKTSSLHSDLSSLVQKVDKLADIMASWREQMVAQAAQVRPGLREILNVATSLAVLFAAVCTGITYIVVSQVTPSITEIKKDGESRESRLARMESAWSDDTRDELRQLRSFWRGQITGLPPQPMPAPVKPAPPTL